MHLRPQLSSIRSRFGYPYHPWWNQEFDETGFKLVQKSTRQGRFHDVTLLIESTNGCFALMSKHSYPPGVFRSPSGGVNPGEDIAAGALREAREETGLRVDLKRFLAHITLDITHQDDLIIWDSYLFHATTKDTQLKPTDLKEVQDTLWATPAQMDLMIHNLKATGNGGLNYRANLTQLSLWALKNELNFRPAGPSDRILIDKALLHQQLPLEELEKAVWWTAQVNKETAAVVGLASRADCVEMIGLNVEPSFQGRGVGQALVEYVCDQWRDPAARKKMKGFEKWGAQEPLWLMTAMPGYYLNIDFDLMDAGQAPRSLQAKARGSHSRSSSMRSHIYRSQSR